jgi:restriction system protein
MKQQEVLLLVLAGVAIPLTVEAVKVLYLKAAARKQLVAILAFLVVIDVAVLVILQAGSGSQPAGALPPQTSAAAAEPSPQQPPTPPPPSSPAVLGRGALALPTSPPSPKGAPTCPDCSGPMVFRTRRATGDLFYGCARFPDCRGTRSFQGPDAAEAVAPAEARTKVGEMVTVRFKVAEVRLSIRSSLVFCHDQPYRRNAKDLFTVVIDTDATGLDAKNLLWKFITVTGKVVEYQGRPEIKVNSKTAIKVE